MADDPRLIEYLITELANRYADGDKLAAAIALGTEAAGKWLKNLADKWRTMNPEERAIFRRMQYHFINAAADGRDNVIKFLLTFFPRYAYNWSKALKAALENGHTKVVREILFAPSTQGIRQRLANLKTADDGTFLIDAIHKGNDAMADILLDAGVDVNVKDIYGITALALAAENQKVNIIKKILARGVRPEILNLVNPDTGETPLTTVINKKGSLEIIKALVKAGAIVTQKNEDDETPVQVAQRSGADKAVIEFLTYGEI